MLRNALLAALVFLAVFQSTAPAQKSEQTRNFARPALIEAESLNEFEDLSEFRQTLIRKALEIARAGIDKSYIFGGASPETGFDCSGAIHCILNACEIQPPRTSAGQFLWLRDHKSLTEFPEHVESLDHQSFAHLTPGDLLFWSGTYTPTDGRTVKITHVAIYLGTEKSDNRPVMISSTEGRSYRAQQASGLGVYDFKLPKKSSRSQFVGYGTIPDILKTETPPITTNSPAKKPEHREPTPQKPGS